MDPFTTTTLLLLFTEELLATDDEDFAELEDATELLDPSTSLGMTLEEGGSSTLEDDSTELEEVTELELATELLDPSTPALPPLRACPEPVEGMTLEEELPGSSVGDEVVKIEEDDTSAGFSSPDEPFAEVLSSQATRPKASANATLVKKFFFISISLKKKIRYPSKTASIFMQICPSGSS